MWGRQSNTACSLIIDCVDVRCSFGAEGETVIHRVTDTLDCQITFISDCKIPLMKSGGNKNRHLNFCF